MPEIWVNDKYAPKPRAYADLQEPLGMFRRLADPELSKSLPLHPFAKALFEHDWSAPVSEIAQRLEQEPDQIRELARIFSGVLSHETENDTISLIIPNQLQPVNQPVPALAHSEIRLS